MAYVFDALGAILGAVVLYIAYKLSRVRYGRTNAERVKSLSDQGERPRNISTRRGSPDRIGMGAKEDFYSQLFVPGESHRAEQLRRAQGLMATGVSAEEAADMLSIPASEILAFRRSDSN